MPTQETILSPSEFAWFQLGMKSLYDWQIECLESIGLQESGGKATSVVAANGSGKTSNLVAPAVLWFLSWNFSCRMCRQFTQFSTSDFL